MHSADASKLTVSEWTYGPYYGLEHVRLLAHEWPRGGWFMCCGMPHRVVASLEGWSALVYVETRVVPLYSDLCENVAGVEFGRAAHKFECV